MRDEMTNVLPGGGTITISGRDARALITARDGNAALLYLHILASGGAFSYAAAARTLGCTEQEIRRAMGVLGGIGLVEAPAAAPAVMLQREELPEYSAADVTREMHSGSAFSGLVDEVQRMYGKLLSSDGLKKLFGIYDSLGMPPEVILMLLTHCIEEYQRKNGPGRMPSMGYVEKAAFTWHNAGVYTLEQAESYLRAMDDRRLMQQKIRKLLGIQDRALSASEQKYVEKWASMGFSIEVIDLAYDRTVMHAKSFGWRYMDSILTSWKDRGFTTVEEIEAGDQRPAERGKQNAPLNAAQTERQPQNNELDELRRFLGVMGNRER